MTKLDLSRYEFKYLLRPEQFAGVRRFLSQYCELDQHAQGEDWYGIRSLYLDTDDYRLFRISADKQNERLKLRVRGYVRSSGAVKMEVKRRNGDLISKSSLVLPSSQLLSGRAAAECEGEDFWRLADQLRAQPKVLVQYERQAYFSRVDDYVRVTFDRHIQCQPLTFWSLEPNQRVWVPVDDPASPSELSSAYVMELKFRVAPPAWLRDLVVQFGLARRGFSKYVRSVKRLHNQRAMEWDLRNLASALEGSHVEELRTPARTVPSWRLV
jgi:hypothetical protein